MTNDDICSQCGHPRSKHDIDPMTGEPTKCPAKRAEPDTPPQEHDTHPRGDY